MSKLLVCAASAKIATITRKVDQAFYDDIMSTDDIIVSASFVSAGGSTTKPSVEENYYANRRMNTKGDCVGIDGWSSMNFVDATSRSRGNRPNEIARTAAYNLKQRITENKRQQHLAQRRRNEHCVEDAKQKREEKKRQEEADQQYFQQTRRELEGPVRAVVASTAEEDPTW
jgi:hypothetical protein